MKKTTLLHLKVLLITLTHFHCTLYRNDLQKSALQDAGIVVSPKHIPTTKEAFHNTSEEISMPYSPPPIPPVPIQTHKAAITRVYFAVQGYRCLGPS